MATGSDVFNSQPTFSLHLVPILGENKGKKGAGQGIAGMERGQCLENLVPELLCVYGDCEVSWLTLS